MGNRNVEVRPVGAWVQPDFEVESSDVPDAIAAAFEEELRIQAILQQKKEKILKFQEDVKKRVRRLNKMKRKNEMQQNMMAVEQERDIVRQSSKSAEVSTPRKNNCLLRKDQEHSIKPKSTPILQGGRVQNEETHLVFRDKSSHVHQMTSQARQKLVSHRIVTHDFTTDDLPGGIWRSSATRDKPRYLTEQHVEQNVEEEELSSKDTDQNDGDEEEEKEEDENENHEKMVHFKLPSEEVKRKYRHRVKSAGNVRPHSSVPDIYIGVEQEVERRRQQNQHALYRRLFMDIEREQVKENLRRQEHRRRIQRLKKEKEEERKQEEENSLRLVRPRHPATGETTEEVLLREQLAEIRLEETLDKFNEERRKATEMTRYVEALRHSLQEKVKKRGIQIPPLCCCGNSVWDTSPDTCANNCYFYRNPRAYAKALQSLLVSCEVV
ncbi:coiled-coil domain-containing protein 15-like [Gigantopelta aegis]|uniref:coiled-coil domain-containing protein 15-like n=1 Tax=Gigantopelta aegis TaxID=1735272 RepID=UPI001B88754C|nr:coiled-coil domain-containing protein 15-like [Gigantopelta aegis]